MPDPPKWPPTEEFRFVLNCQTAGPLRVGSGMMSELTDSEPRRRADARLVIPGSAIAGALRGAVERFAIMDGNPKCRFYAEPIEGAGEQMPCECPVCGLFGNMAPVDTARASKVWAHDVLIPRDAVVRIVDGVGIDRARRAAADARKFDYAEIRPGVNLWIDVRAEKLSDTEYTWLGAALRMMSEGEIPLGANAARGAGRLKPGAAPTRAAIRSRNLAASDQILAMALSNEREAVDFLNSDPVWPTPRAENLDAFPKRKGGFLNRFLVSFTLVPDPEQGATFLVDDPVESMLSGWDRAPRGDQAGAELPAASLRGALRSGAERILRTIAGDAKKVCDPTRSPCREPTGWQPGERPAPGSWCCPACLLFGNTDLASRLFVSVRRNQPSRTVPFDHLAIDRFTGGSRDTLKFDALAARGGMFHVSLTLDRVSQEECLWMLGLLALTLHDLCQARITIGQGASKGHGIFQSVNLNWGELRRPVPEAWEDAIRAVWARVGREYPSEMAEESP